MARLLTSGFELNSTTAGVEFDTLLGSTGLSIQGTYVRSGSYAMQVNNATSGTLAGARWIVAALTTGHTYSARVYIYLITLPTGNYGIIFEGSNGSSGWEVHLNTDGTLQLAKASNDAAIGSPSSAINTGQWYRLEVSYNYATSTATAYLDGVQFASGAADTNIALTDFDAFFYGQTGNTGINICFDDVAVNDDTGSYQTTLPGAGNVIMLQPSGAGESNTWLKTTGAAGDANNYTLVNEKPPDGATTFIESNLLTAIDLYTCPASGIPASATVNLV